MGKRIERISAIPLNSQRFKCIFINRMTLMDSTAFLPSSLDELARTLRVSDHEFGILRQWPKLRLSPEEEEEEEEESLTEEEKEALEKKRFEAATRKGVFCYDHVTGGDMQLKRESHLPPLASFHNRLTGENATEEEYAFAQSVFDMFRCRNMMDYARLYMEIDVFLLAEAVMNMRKTLYEEFRLDMCQYLSLPMMAKDVMLKVTGAEIELISDYDMVLMLQRGIRGGMSFIGQRLVELDAQPSPVPKMKEEFLAAAAPTEREREKLRERVARKQTEGWVSADPDTGEDRTMMYVDANNLYGHSMTFPLPYDDFAWMSEKEIEEFTADVMGEKGGKEEEEEEKRRKRKRKREREKKMANGRRRLCRRRRRRRRPRPRHRRRPRHQRGRRSIRKAFPPVVYWKSPWNIPVTSIWTTIPFPWLRNKWR
jgi:hypothetical protein